MVVFPNRFIIYKLGCFRSETLQPIYSSLFSLLFSLRPGSVIVYFVLYFKTALTPEKGLENLKIVISTNGTFGRYKARDLLSLSDSSTASTTPAGINDVRILSIHPSSHCLLSQLRFSLYLLSVLGLHVCFFSFSFSFSSSLLFFCCLRTFLPIQIFFRTDSILR